jgi:hypothetical protein
LEATQTPSAAPSAADSTPYGFDVRVAQLELGPGVPVSWTAPAWTSARVSQFPFGIADFEAGTLQQLQFNPPNLPLYGRGKIPFIGDYIEIAGLDFLPNGDGTWRTNTAWTPAPVFHATWTSNQNVRPPPTAIGRPTRRWAAAARAPTTPPSRRPSA